MYVVDFLPTSAIALDDEYVSTYFLATYNGCVFNSLAYLASHNLFLLSICLFFIHQ